MISKKILVNAETIQKVLGETEEMFFTISTDTRSLVFGEVFVALDGENFNGGDYLEEAINKGAAVLVYSQTEKNQMIIEQLTVDTEHVMFIEVKNTIQYLQQVAYAHKQAWLEVNKKEKIIFGITGSNGKTTNKDMLTHLMESVFPHKVLSTFKNLNNHIGVPKTIFQLNLQHEILILELGMNHPGEIQVLVDIATPMAGLITNIGTAHLEFMESMENIYLEKKCLYDGIIKNSNGRFFILNLDDPYLKLLPVSDRVKTFSSIDKNADYFLTFEAKSVVVTEKKSKNKFVLANDNLTGKHNYINLAETFILAVNCYPEKKEQFRLAAGDFRPKDNRSTWIAKGNAQIFLDAYNANPSSMESSIRGFFEHCSQTNIAVDHQLYLIGDMNELGSFTEQGHYQIGALLKDLGVVNLIFVGKNSLPFIGGLGKDCQVYPNVGAIPASKWEGVLANFKSIFIKGSRSLQLESLVDI